MTGSISLTSVLDMLAVLTTEQKRWLAAHLQEQVAREEKFDVTKTQAYKEAMADVEAGRVTEYASAQDLFDKFGI